MRSKAVSAGGQRSGRTQGRRARSTKTERVEENLGAEVERPMDAEDIALASLEAQVRAEEMRADLGSTTPHGGLSVRLPHVMIVQLRAEAAKRHITPSELVMRALMQYRPLKKVGYRLSARQAGG